MAVRERTRAFGQAHAPVKGASFRRPSRLEIDSDRNVYVVDALACRIRKIDVSGTITTIAGNGEAGFSGAGGPAVRAALGHPNDVAVDRLGNVYISDRDNIRIRRVTPDGVITATRETQKCPVCRFAHSFSVALVLAS